MISDNYSNLSWLYDKIHSGKDYASEAGYIVNCADRHGDYSKVGRILDFGCGTCSHIEHLASNKLCVGVDTSESMLEIARAKQIKNLKLYNCDISNLVGVEKFDMCISMFHVINHVHTLRELETIFSSIGGLLRPGSLFMFDCFNAVAAFRDPPRDRAATIKIDNEDFSYLSRCDLDLMNSYFTMSNALSSEESKYEHNLRQTLWTPKVIHELLYSSGFKLINIYKNFTFEEAGHEDYKIFFVARKVA